MTEAQMRQAVDVIEEFDYACREHVMKGSYDPTDHEQIQRNYTNARDALFKWIKDNVN